MTIEETIKKAVKGGYTLYAALEGDEGYQVCNHRMFLAPSFWQSLGKALGWREATHIVKEDTQDDWLYHWHRFIDHLAENKTVESFFESL
jgi:hypothetical protein